LPVNGKEVHLTNLDKLFWPERGITKGNLIQYYAELLSFVFEPREFYDLEHIKLRTMPYYQIQEQYLISFRQRVSRLMIEALKEGRSMSLLQAEHAIWQQIERELLTSA